MNEEKENEELIGEDRSSDFAKGVLCGVILALICMAASLWFFQWRTTRQMERMRSTHVSGPDNGTSGTEKETERELLDMDVEAIAAKLRELQGLINDGYLDDVDEESIEDALFAGVIDGLDDPYSTYYNKETWTQLKESTSGFYSGIGVLLTQDPDTKIIRVVNCFADTPAMRAGVQNGDRILKIGDEETAHMDLAELVARIKQAHDSELTLELERDGESITITVACEEIRVPTVSGEMLEDHIGYLDISEFSDVTTQQFYDELQKLTDAGMEKLIIDLRDNPGGVLSVACDIADGLLPEGMIVYTEDKNGKREPYFSDDKQMFFGPLAVLINENSASSTEILAGAIKDHQIGILIGRRTFGKGVVQRLYHLQDGSGLKLTVARYYTPNGHDIHRIGITPDIEIEPEEDQLAEAVRILKTEK